MYWLQLKWNDKTSLNCQYNFKTTQWKLAKLADFSVYLLVLLTTKLSPKMFCHVQVLAAQCPGSRRRPVRLPITCRPHGFCAEPSCSPPSPPLWVNWCSAASTQIFRGPFWYEEYGGKLFLWYVHMYPLTILMSSISPSLRVALRLWLLKGRLRSISSSSSISDRLIARSSISLSWTRPELITDSIHRHSDFTQL